MKITATKRKIILATIGVFIVLLSSILILIQLGVFGDNPIHLGGNPRVVYGPVLGDISGGSYSLLWVTDSPVKSSIDFGVGTAALSEASRYHFYKIDASKVGEGDNIEMMHGPTRVETLTVTDQYRSEVLPDLPFVGYGEIEGLSQNEGFVVIDIDGNKYISLVKDGRWSVDFPKSIEKKGEGTLTIVKEKELFTTQIRLGLVQPAQTIVLNKTEDRIKPQTNSFIEEKVSGLISKVFACEGDVGEWEISCPNGESYTEADKCTQDTFMNTHSNGYDQWAYEACGCPLDGETWKVVCNDGSTFEEADMCSHDLFYRVHGEMNGFKQWQIEACQGKGGPKELQDEQDGSWNRTPFDKSPPTVNNQQPKVEAPYICCWGESGGSYAGPTDVNPQCIGGTYQVGTAQTSSGCEPQFNQDSEILKKIADEIANQPPAPQPPSSTPYDPAIDDEDMKNYNPNYPSKSDSTGRLCDNFPESVLFWSQNITYWADQYGLDPNMMATVMSVESCGNPTALSTSGAQSLYQVMPSHFGAGENAWDPDTNAKAAAKFLSIGMDEMDGDVGLTFAGYNAGYWGIIADGYEKKDSWPLQVTTYYDLTMGLWNDSQDCGNTRVGTDNFLAKRRYACADAMAVLNAGSYSDQSSDVNNQCFKPDKTGSCSTALCDDKLGESCTKDPDSCVYGGICIAGKCEYYEKSGCSYPGDEDSPTAPPPSNNKPVRVSKMRNTGGTYPVIEYNEQKGSSYDDTPNKYPHEYIVLHWTAGGESQKAINVVNAFRGMRTGTNYTVDRDGEIHYQYPVGQTLFNARDEYINASSISFENVGTGGTTWSTLNYTQAMADVQQIERHIDAGDTVAAAQLKVVGHFEVKNAAGNSDPGKDFMTWVCTKLHEDGYKVKCNWGVDSSYNIDDSRIAADFSLLSAPNSIVGRVDARESGYAGPGMYHITFAGYRLHNTAIYLQKDLDDTVFYEDLNGNGSYDSAEDLNLKDKITSLKKISNDYVVELEDQMNFESFPVLPEGVSTAQEMVDYINSHGGDVQSISRLHNGEWQTFVYKEGEAYSEDFGLNPMEPYYIKLKYKTTIFIDASDANYEQYRQLSSGWNPIVVGDSSGSLKGSEMKQIYPSTEGINSVFYWDGGKYVGITFDEEDTYGKDFILEDGKPYWVRVEE